MSPRLWYSEALRSIGATVESRRLVEARADKIQALCSSGCFGRCISFYRHDSVVARITRHSSELQSILACWPRTAFFKMGVRLLFFQNGCLLAACSRKAIDLRTGEQWGNTPCTSALPVTQDCLDILGCWSICEVQACTIVQLFQMSPRLAE